MGWGEPRKIQRPKENPSTANTMEQCRQKVRNKTEEKSNTRNEPKQKKMVFQTSFWLEKHLFPNFFPNQRGILFAVQTILPSNKFISLPPPKAPPLHLGSLAHPSTSTIHTRSYHPIKYEQGSPNFFS